MNAAAGKEREYEIKRVEKKKKVLIVGGGLAGMEAARVAALRGHDVTLCDKAPKLGGLVPVAAIVKERELEALVDIIRYFENQLIKLGVTLKLGVTADLAMIHDLKPDAVILGTGGLTAVPGIPGIDNRKVVRSEKLHRTLKRALKFFGPKALEKLTRLWMPLGKRVVIIGGGIQGCQLAHFLTLRRRKVTIVDTAETLGDGMPFQTPLRHFNWFDQEGVVMLPGVTYEKITDEGLIVKTKEGIRKVLEADSIVLALPLIPDNSLYKILEKEAMQVFQVGDCREFGLMHGAIADGAQIGRAI
jgi:2,4-dienoyl-CoA reductase (NADPH2)